MNGLVTRINNTNAVVCVVSPASSDNIVIREAFSLPVTNQHVEYKKTCYGVFKYMSFNLSVGHDG